MYRILFVFCLISTSLCSQKTTESSPTISLNSSEIDNLNLFFEAVKAKSLYNIEKATSLIDQYLEKDQSNAAAYYEGAQLYMAAENEIKTKSYIEKAISLDPNNKWYSGFYLEYLNKIGDYESALHLIETKLKLKKDDVSMMQYSFLLQKSGKYSKALKVLSDMEKSNALDENILMQKFQIYYKQKDIEHAEVELKKIIQLDPTNVQSYFNLAEFYVETNNKSESTKIYNNILYLEPNNPQALLHLTGEAIKSKDTITYKNYSLRIIQNNLINLDTKIQFLSLGLMNFAKLDSSNKSFYMTMADTLVSIYPKEAKSNAILGDFYFLNSNYDKARSSYINTLKYKVENIEVWQNLFSSLFSLKNFQELADSSQAALEYFPASSVVYFYNALANQQLKNYSQSEKSFKKALRFVGEDKAFEAQLYANLGETYHLMKNTKASDEAFENALKLDQDNVTNLNNYAYYLSIRKEKLDEARKMSRKTIDISPKNSNFLDTYAWICFQMGNFDEAKKYQEEAIEIEKEDKSTIYDHYGDILFKLGDIDGAMNYWKKALDSGSKSKILPKKISTKNYIESIE